MSLIAHYPFIKNGRDILVYQNHARILGPLFGGIDPASKLGGYLTFSLDTNQVIIPNIRILSEKVFGPTRVASISIWVFPTAWEDFGAVISKATGNDYSNATFSIWTTASGFRVIVGTGEFGNPTGSYIYITHKPELNKWHHLVAVMDGADLIFYVNRTEVGRQPLSDITRLRSQNDANIIIGSRVQSAGDSKLRGRICDLRVFDHALSLREIKELYSAKVVHYTFNEQSYIRNNLLSVSDTSTFERHSVPLPLSISPTWTEDGMVGKGSYDFSKRGRMIEIPYGKGIDLSLVPHTISLMVKTPSVDPAVVIETSGDNNFSILKHHGKWGFIVNDIEVDYGLSEIDVIPNRWTHVALVFDGTNVNLYIDAILAKSIPYYSFSFSSNLFLGCSYAGDTEKSWDGIIDDVRIYSSAMTEKDVKSIYTQRSSIDESGILYVQEFHSFIGFNHEFSNNPFHLGGTDIQFFRDGYMRIKSLDSSPYIDADDFAKDINHKLYSKFQMKYRVAEGDPELCKIYFSDDDTFDEDRSVDGILLSNGDWNVVTVDMNSNGDWDTTNVNNIRIQYSKNADITIDIEFIRLVKNDVDFNVDIYGIFGASSISEANIANGLIGWWPLDNSTENLANVEKEAKIYGDLIPARGVLDMSYGVPVATESAGYLSIPIDDVDLKHGSLSFWFYLHPDYNWDTTFSIVSNGKDLEENGVFSLMKNLGSTIRFLMRINNVDYIIDTVVDGSVFSGKWANFTLQFSDADNDGVNHLYINGEHKGSIEVVEINTSNDQELFFVPKSNTGKSVRSRIDDIRLYNRFLSGKDIKYIYNYTDETNNLMRISESGKLYIKGKLEEVY